MRGALIAMLLLMAGCPCPDYRMGVAQSGYPAPMYTDIALDVVEENPLCTELPFGGWVYWTGSPLDPDMIRTCGIPAYGCSDVQNCRFVVWVTTLDHSTREPLQFVWQTALVHEIGHWYWNQCHSGPAHWTETDASGNVVIKVDPAFAAWENDIRAEIMLRVPASVPQP